MRKLTLALPVILAACGTPPAAEPVVVKQVVDRQVAISCVPQSTPSAPTYPDTNDALLGAPDAAERFRLLAAGRIQRTERLGMIEPIILACGNR